MSSTPTWTPTIIDRISFSRSFVNKRNILLAAEVSGPRLQMLKERSMDVSYQ